VEPPPADTAHPRAPGSWRARLASLAHSAWPVRLAWVVQPLTLGPAIGDGLADASRPVQVVASAGAWVIWLGVLVATLVPTTLSLTVLRTAAPAGAVAGVAALMAAGTSATTVVGLAGALVALLVAVAPETAEVFVDGSSYGDERRLPLKIPLPLLAGPTELAWAGIVAGVCAGPLLLAARQWVLGSLACVVGAAVAWWGVRVLHTLSRRWLVFVPAGVVVHDPLTLVEPILLRRGTVRSFGPAPAGSDALDLTGAAAGLAVEIGLTETVGLLPLPRGRGQAAELVDVRAVLVSPSRPGRAVAEARRRRLG
jgi:hypothetical protein